MSLLHEKYHVLNIEVQNVWYNINIMAQVSSLLYNFLYPIQQNHYEKGSLRDKMLLIHQLPKGKGKRKLAVLMI